MFYIKQKIPFVLSSNAYLKQMLTTQKEAALGFTVTAYSAQSTPLHCLPDSCKNHKMVPERK